MPKYFKAMLPVFYHSKKRDEMFLDKFRKINFHSKNLDQISNGLKFYSQKFGLKNLNAKQLGINKPIISLKIDQSKKYEFFVPKIEKNIIEKLQISESKKLIEKLITEDEYNFFINNPDLQKNYKIYLNPKIEYLGKNKKVRQKCFSIYGISAEIERNDKIKVNYQNIKLEKKMEILENENSFEFQQSYDFLSKKSILNFSRNKFRIFKEIEKIPTKFELFFSNLEEFKKEARDYLGEAGIKEVLDDEENLYVDFLDEDFDEEFELLLESLDFHNKKEMIVI